MERKLLELTPKMYLCPYCGEWHKWNLSHELGYYDSLERKAKLKCEYGSKFREMSYYFDDKYCYYRTEAMCERGNLEIDSRVSIAKIFENSKEPYVTFSILHTTASDVGSRECHLCLTQDKCLILKLGNETDNRRMFITFGFAFEQSDYEVLKKENKEGKQMAKTTFLEQLYEHSPKENVEKVKELLEKHKDTLKWAIPVASIYGAYRVLKQKKSSITVENIGSECEKAGFSMDYLNDKAVLKDLLKWGGVVAGVYATTKAISTIRKNDEEISVENLEEGLDELEGARKKLSFIQPKIDKLLPVAVSVIIVYVMTQKPAWFETWKNKISKSVGGFSTKISIGWELFKLFVADKLHVNFDDEAEVQKFRRFACLTAIVGIGVFIYGKKILKKKTAEDKQNQEINELMGQIMSVMKKLMPTAFAGLGTFLVTKNVLESNDIINDDDEDFDSEKEESDEKVEEVVDEEKTEEADE